MKKINTTSGALRAAKLYLFDGQQDRGQPWGWKDGRVQFSYICAALAQAYDCGEITRRALIRARGEVMARLAPHTSVPSWLDDNVKGGIKVWFHRQYNRNERAFWQQQMQAYRYRWVNALIKEYEAKGD